MNHTPETIEEAAGIAALPASRWRFVPFVGFQLLSFGQFTSSIWILWLAHRGYSLGEIGLAESCYHLGRVVLTVPTGAFADTFGRKWSLVASSFVLAAGVALEWWSPVLPVVAFALFLDGGSAAFRLGADQAYLFDTLSAESKGNRFTRMLSSVLAASYLVAALTAWLGAWLSDFTYTWPFALTLGAAAIAAVLAALLPEPPPAATTERTARGVLQIMTDGVQAVRVRPVLVRLIVFSSAFFVANTLGSIYMQSVLKGRGFGNGSIGFVIGIAGIASALATFGAGHLPRWWQSWTAFTLLAAVTGVAVAAQGTPLIALILLGMTARELSVGIFEPLIANRLNEETPTAVRATVLSLSEMGFSLGMIPLFPLVGWLSDRNGWGVAFGVVAVGLAAVIVSVRLSDRRPAP